MRRSSAGTGVCEGRRPPVGPLLLLAALLAAPGAGAGEWPSWRGPQGHGVAGDTGLVASWSPEGENLIWKADLIGRSTPVVLDGRVCVMGRTDDARRQRQEQVACFDAGTGRLLWEHRYNVYNTTVPFQRVGWASPVFDPETGTLYTMGVAGQLHAYGPDGKLVWSYFLTEDFGRLSGYGGRTQTPVIDGDLLLLSVVNAGWGNQGPPRNRYFAFDKSTGEVVWVSAPGRYPEDMNTQSVPVVADIGGQRLLVNGNADGWIYALKVGTGEKVWEFELSKRGLNADVLVDGNVVYAMHSEENIDAPTMGRVVAIDGTGRGDVSKTHEIWRHDELAVGFASPALHGGRLYVVDNSANLHALDKETGKTLWKFSLGTVGKGSPVLADGKLYVGEVNGRFHIIEPGRDGARSLDVDELRVPDGRYAEIYGSPAIAYGRVYFTTEGGLYCLGDKSAKFRVAPDPLARRRPPKGKAEGPPTVLQVVPAEVLLRPGESVPFRVRTFDARGRRIGETGATWGLEGLEGTVDAKGRFTADSRQKFQAGTLVARVGALQASARVRVIGELPWSFDFETMDEGRAPAWWIGAGQPWQVRAIDGNKMLVKIVRESGLLRNALFMGPSTLGNFTIQADVYGNKKGRRLPDMGLIGNGYTLDLMGNQQQLQLRSWTSELRMAAQLDWAWETETWYTLKLRVDAQGDTARIRGKVWPRGSEEPQDWTIQIEDPLPIPTGSPGLVGYSPAEVYFDNVRITVNE